MNDLDLPYSITLLPSGFYAVWVSGEWVSASHRTEADAIAFAKNFVKKEGKRSVY